MVDFTEFDLGGNRYQIATMDAMTGAKILKRMSRMLGPILRITAASDGAKDLQSAMGSLYENIDQLTEFLSDMPDEHTDFIFASCLRCVSRTEGGGRGWAPIWNKQAGAPQFADLRPVDLMNIVGRVIKDQVIPFSSGSLLQ